MKDPTPTKTKRQAKPTTWATRGRWKTEPSTEQERFEARIARAFLADGLRAYPTIDPAGTSRLATYVANWRAILAQCAAELDDADVIAMGKAARLLALCARPEGFIARYAARDALASAVDRQHRPPVDRTEGG